MRAILTLAAVWLASAVTPGCAATATWWFPRASPPTPAFGRARRRCRPMAPSVAFEAHVSLDPADQNGKPDVYLLERATNRVTLVSRNLAGGTGRGSSRCPRVSGDGQRVVFESDATDLVEGDTAGTNDVFVFDEDTGALRRIAPMTGAGQP